MARLASGFIILAVFTAALTCSPRLPAEVGDNEEVAELWDQYILEVGRRDEMQVLTCYGEYLYKQLASDRTSAGRARLSVHMGEMFDLLARSFDYEVVQEENVGEKVIYTVKFTHRKKKTVHTSTVEFGKEDHEWKIIKAPELPSFLKPSGGSFKMLAGIAIALVAIIFIAKKLLG